MDKSCNCAPWYRFRRHKWAYSSDEAFRDAARKAKPYDFIMGTFECREIRECSACGRIENRDHYGGNFIPYGWVLRGYKSPDNPT